MLHLYCVYNCRQKMLSNIGKLNILKFIDVYIIQFKYETNHAKSNDFNNVIKIFKEFLIFVVKIINKDLFKN